MPYLIIDKKPVFLSWSRDKELSNEAFRGKDDYWRSKSAFGGSKECKEAARLKYATLKAIKDKNPTGFREHWVKFDLRGNEATENIFDLLYDYCRLYGYAYLSDLRDPVTKLNEDMLGDDYYYPLGRMFLFNHFVNPHRWWWKYTLGMKGRIISIKIITQDVDRLVGDLANFSLYQKGLWINFSRNLELRAL